MRLDLKELKLTVKNDNFADLAQTWHSDVSYGPNQGDELAVPEI